MNPSQSPGPSIFPAMCRCMIVSLWDFQQVPESQQPAPEQEAVTEESKPEVVVEASQETSENPSVVAEISSDAPATPSAATSVASPEASATLEATSDPDASVYVTPVAASPPAQVLIHTYQEIIS